VETRTMVSRARSSWQTGVCVCWQLHAGLSAGARGWRSISSC